MVPPLRYRGCGVKALLVPDSGQMRQPNPRRTVPWLIILNRLGLSGRRSIPAPVPPHANFRRIHRLCNPARRFGRCRRQPRFHRRQSGRRLRGRRVPRQRREMRRPCRPRLLPVTGICFRHRLSPGRSRRNYQRPSERRRRDMHRQWRRRIRRHHLRALSQRLGTRAGVRDRPATSAPRKRRDDAPRSGYWMRPWPRHAGLGRGRRALMPGGSALNGRICWKFKSFVSPLGF